MKTKINIAKFNELKNISPIIENTNKEAKKEIKFKLLDGLQEGLSDKWYNLKKATQQALQYACMRSTEQGFFFFAPTHLNEKFKVSITTIYSILKELIESGKLVKVNRTATTHNGKGNAVYIFTEHPNFPAICELLGLDWKTDCKADCKAESAETPCGSKVEGDNSASTYLLPTSLQNLKDNVKHNNVQDDNVIDSYDINDSFKILQQRVKEYEQQENQKPYEKPAVKWYKYVPKAINEKFGYFGSILTELWRKIKLAERKVVGVSLSDDERKYVAENVLENLKKHPRFKSMSVDEMCAYVYKGQLNGLFNLIGNENLENMFIDTESEYYAYLDVCGDHIPTTTKVVVVQEDTVDWWFSNIHNKLNKKIPLS